MFADVAELADVPVGLWCGTDDGLYDAVVALEAALPESPDIASYSQGDHSRFYWNDQTLAAFDFLASSLT